MDVVVECYENRHRHCHLLQQLPTSPPNSRCHTDNCRRADSASSHAPVVVAVVVAPVVVVVVPVVPSLPRSRLLLQGQQTQLASSNEGHKDCRKLVFHNFSFIHRWTIRTLEIRIVYFEYNILVNLPFLIPLALYTAGRKGAQREYKIVNYPPLEIRLVSIR